MKHHLKGFLVYGFALASIGAIVRHHTTAAETDGTKLNQISYVSKMLSESHDLRFAIYLGAFGSLASLKAAETNGTCLVVLDGDLRGAKYVSTNECPTVQSILSKFGRTGSYSQPQLRTIQKNSILQSGFNQESELRGRILNLKVGAGDIVVMARKG